MTFDSRSMGLPVATLSKLINCELNAIAHCVETTQDLDIYALALQKLHSLDIESDAQDPAQIESLASRMTTKVSEKLNFANDLPQKIQNVQQKYIYFVQYYVAPENKEKARRIFLNAVSCKFLEIKMDSSEKKESYLQELAQLKKKEIAKSTFSERTELLFNLIQLELVKTSVPNQIEFLMSIALIYKDLFATLPASFNLKEVVPALSENLTIEELYVKMVSNGNSLFEIPFKQRTKAICLAAFRKNVEAFRFVPSALRMEVLSTIDLVKLLPFLTKQKENAAMKEILKELEAFSLKQGDREFSLKEKVIVIGKYMRMTDTEYDIFLSMMKELPEELKEQLLNDWSFSFSRFCEHIIRV